MGTTLSRLLTRPIIAIEIKSLFLICFPPVLSIITLTAIGADKLEAVITALDAGTSKAAVCRSFGVARSTLIDTLARAGWTGPGSVS